VNPANARAAGDNPLENRIALCVYNDEIILTGGMVNPANAQAAGVVQLRK